MGLFGFLKRGDKVAPNDTFAAYSKADSGITVEVNLKDAIALVEKNISGMMMDERVRAMSLYESICEGLADVRKQSMELGKKSFEKGDKTYAVVNMLKDNYAKKANSLISNMPHVSDFNYDEAFAFAAATRRILNELLNIPPKQAVLLTRYFKGDASKIIMTLKDADESCTKLASLLDRSNLMFYSRMKKDVNDMHEMKRRVGELTEMAHALAEKIDAKRSEADKRKRDAEAFAGGVESAKHASLENDMKSCVLERTELGNRLNDELSGLKRPAKKLEHATRGDKNRAALYSRLVHSPLKVLLQEGDSAIRDMLAELEKLSLNNEDKERVNELAGKLELGYLSGLAEKYKMLEGDLAKKKEAFEKSTFPEECMKREREALNTVHEAADMEAEHMRIVKSASDIEAGVKAAKSSLEEFVLKKINIRLNITI